MRWTLVILAIVLGGLSAACQGESESAPAPAPPSSELRGGERLGWDQQVEDPNQSLTFRLWVDGQTREMTSIVCGQASGAGVRACSGILPGMTAGTHFLSVSAVAPDGTEGPQSAPLQVTVASPGTSRLIFHEDLPGATGTTGSAGRTEITASGEPVGPVVHLEVLVDDLREPTDVAVAADGRVLVTERAGAVRVVVDGVVQSAPMLMIDDVTTDAGSGLLSLELDPEFARNGFVYLGYTADTGFRVARYRAVAGTLGDRSIVFETSPDRPYTAADVRFGPDRQLYVALDDEGDPGLSGDLGSMSGKVLRLNTDGSVPADAAGFSPVYAADLRAPQALDWSPTDQGLWIAEGNTAASGLLTVLRDDAASRRAAIVARYTLPHGDVPSAALFYRGAAFRGWTGDLLIGLKGSGQLLRLRLDPADATKVIATAIVLDGTAGPIRALAEAADGSVFVAGDHALMRLTPAAGS